VIAREKDFGMNDIQFTCVTHLGPVLHAGDLVLGYDLTNTNFNIDEAGEKSFQKIAKNIPDVVLVRKVRKKSILFISFLIVILVFFCFQCYERKGDRKWTLKNLKTTAKNFEDEEENEVDAKKQDEYDADREDFMQQLESDREMRSHMNLYKKKLNLLKKSGATAGASTAMETVAEGADGEENGDEDDDAEESDEEEIQLDELLDDMTLSMNLLGGLDQEGGAAENANKEIKVLSEDELKHITLLEEQPSPVPSTNNFDSSPFEGKAFKFV
jgi:nonsense-mediated mRNA decay protein 3